MNQRIQVLAEQARKHFPKTETSGEFWVFDEEKFAMLIVQECMRVALDEIVPDSEIDKTDDIKDRCYLRGNNGGIVDAVVAIKQNFGIEE